MRAGESFAGGPDPSTLLTATSDVFFLTGGKYWYAVVGGFDSGTITLQRKGPDGQTWLKVATAAAVTADGGTVLECPPGRYRVLVSGTTQSVSWEVVRINEE